MSHPFFDFSIFPWDRSEATELHSRLTGAITNTTAINLIYRHCVANPSPLLLTQAPNYIWVDTLDRIASAGRLRVLCDHLLLLPELQHAEIQDAIKAVINAQVVVAVTTIPKAHLIADDIYVLDRQNLSRQLAELKQPNLPKRVILVRGQPETGKSHGRLLFELAARQVNALPIYLDRDLMPTVDVVVESLFGALNASEGIPKKDTTSEAWYGTVCRRLRELAAKSQTKLWIAIDDLGLGRDGGPLLDTEIRKFCDQLVLNMKDPSFRDWFRLMLIHYPADPLPARWDRNVCLRDTTSEADVQVEHVVELLQIWLDQRSLRLTEQEILDLAGEVIAEADGAQPAGLPTPPRLQRIHDALADTLARIGSNSP